MTHSQVLEGLEHCSESIQVLLNVFDYALSDVRPAHRAHPPAAEMWTCDDKQACLMFVELFPLLGEFLWAPTLEPIY